MSSITDALSRLYAADDLEALAEAADATGHIPSPWDEYLDWVLVHQATSPAAAELRRIIVEVLG